MRTRAKSSDETKRKHREVMLRKWQDPTYREMQVASHVGQVGNWLGKKRPPFSKETLEKMRGHTPWNKGKPGILKGPRNPMWQGGRISNGKGYVIVLAPNHPQASKTGYVLEHRLVVEKALGRFLEKNEVVHHLNHIKTDNRIENLKVITQSEHMKIHALNGKWARLYDECIRCNLTIFPHTAQGLCRSCYKKWLKHRFTISPLQKTSDNQEL